MQQKPPPLYYSHTQLLYIAVTTRATAGRRVPLLCFAALLGRVTATQPLVLMQHALCFAVCTQVGESSLGKLISGDGMTAEWRSKAASLAAKVLPDDPNLYKVRGSGLQLNHVTAPLAASYDDHVTTPL